MNYNQQYHSDNKASINDRHRQNYYAKRKEILEKKRLWYVENAGRLKIKRMRGAMGNE